MGLYTHGRERDSNLARPKTPAITPSAEPVQVIKPKNPAISLVSETRGIIPSGVAISETEQEE